ncbi:MAG TPA: SDR family oxidoreductase [Candidatus Dormibacteraeota bacterium]|nr:SDR family oxidoreductase [Candidatus Dormibacteraeota bacterium]
MDSADSRVAVVTGAGTGIGAATAKLFGAKGMAVVLVGRRHQLLEETAASILSGGGRALVLTADLANPEVPQRIVADTLKEFGQLDVLVNNAATIKVGPLETYTIADFDSHIAINVRAIYFLIQQALPALKRSQDAAIVNISSTVGSVVKPGNSLYGMSKAAVEYLSRSLAFELAPQRIRVNCLASGSVKTPIHLIWAGSLAKAEQDLVPRIPLGRMAEPEEMAYWIYQLVSPDTSFATGEVFHIDGGQALGTPE